jgi:PEP-CTERM motif
MTPTSKHAGGIARTFACANACACACALAATLATPAAHAQANTGSLAGWNVNGDVIAAAGAITLTTAFTDETPFNLSGNAAADIGVIETAAGLAPYALDFAAEAGYEGSLVGQRFGVTAGQSLSFDWSFATLDRDFLDRAFVVLDGTLVTLATRALPGAATQTFSHTFAGAGTATLAIGVIDTGDFTGVSSMTVRNLALAGGVAPVPEPSTWALLAGGLGLVGWATRRRSAG